MEIKIFEDIQEYHTLVSPFLIQNEAKNILILALLSGLLKNPLKYGKFPILIAFLEKKTVIFTGLRTPPHNQILAFTENIEYVEMFSSFLYDQKQEIPGMLGSKESALKFAQEWENLNQTPYQLDMHERIYELTKVNPVTLGKNEFRQINLQDLDTIVKWSRAMQLEALGIKIPEDDETLKNDLIKNDIWKSFYVLCKDDGLLTMAKKAGTTPTGQLVNYVYTPPELRRNGYATECVAKLSQLCLDEGKQRCLLI